MLTENQAKLIISNLNLLKTYHVHMAHDISRSYANKIITLQNIINAFTEKPKLQAKVGYYYKDGFGDIELVTQVTPLRIVTNYGNFYRLNGAEFEGIDDRNNLDLSKPYKLMEAQDVE